MSGGKLHHCYVYDPDVKLCRGEKVVNGQRLSQVLSFDAESYRVLVGLTDQQSTVFNSFQLMQNVYNIRCFWLPGVCHRGSNSVGDVMRLAGLEKQDKTRSWFTGPFFTGPHSRKDGAGKWHQIRTKTWAAIKPDLRDPHSKVIASLAESFGGMAAALGVSPDADDFSMT